MVDRIPPAKKIKTEPIDLENDIEHSIPTFVVKPPTTLLESSVEVIDLTDEEFLNEFKSFLTTLPERRADKDARKNTTKAKSKTSQRTQCMPIDYLEYVCFQQDSFICELFDFTFTNAMLYGRVTAETVKDDMVIYRLDDGTGAVDVFYRAGNKKFRIILPDWNIAMICCVGKVLHSMRNPCLIRLS
ncbi:AGAP007219-PA-like protein [Anopheles sinensis]|uniref:AGAP007219-PA-like protein n=1 Tax=Anopheles sinensis TaxID=74873 RepID=A0A084WES4_ANOSI|nr:AGAP007219-PA-like protein [Anopheles sinensis]